MDNTHATEPVVERDATVRQVDGRTARRDRNRIAVLDAVIELFCEDNLQPGVHEVAERSGVSLRSVYRYFEDIDALIRAAIDRQLQRTRPLFAMDDLGVGPLDERIRRFAVRRVGLFVEVRQIYAASSTRAQTDPLVAEHLVETRRHLSDQVEAMFRPELDARSDDKARLTALTLDVVTQFHSLEHLLADRQLSRDETVAYLVDAIADLLG